MRRKYNTGRPRIGISLMVIDSKLPCIKKDCQQTNPQPVSEFRTRSTTGEYDRRCKSCERARIAKQRLVDKDRKNARQRELQKLRYKKNPEPMKFAAIMRKKNVRLQTPLWADIEAIREIYANRPTGYEVDHIVPLRGKNVWGLHVEYNLQYLTVRENGVKHNKFLLIEHNFSKSPQPLMPLKKAA